MVSCGDLIVRDMRGDCSETCKELIGLRRCSCRRGEQHGLSCRKGGEDCSVQTASVVATETARWRDTWIGELF